MPRPDAPFLSRTAAEPPLPRGCECPGCAAAGDYPAPKGRDRLRDYFWFCLDHVREYNRAWDYYAGMSITQIEAEMRSDTTWQRPSWPLGSWRLDQRLREQVFAEQGFAFGREGGESGESQGHGGAYGPGGPPTAEDEARQVLDLERTASFAEIKARYRELVKAHHPDANGGDKAAEERLKRINQAYTTLKASEGR
ncbi:MAG: DnaJ domain-containing protein [Rhodospirillaceae bacterium]